MVSWWGIENQQALEIVQNWRPRPRARTPDTSTLDSMGTRPRRPRARIKLRAPAPHARVGVYGGERILDDDMAVEGLVGRL